MLGLISPHVGGIRAQANRRYLPDRFSFVRGRDEFKEAYRNNYDNGVVQADNVLSRVWEKLERYGFLNDAIVVITADHGESLGEHGTYGHLTGLAHTELNIPLWIGGMDLSRGQLRFVRQIDVAPTILDAIGLPIPEVWHGLPINRLPPVRWATAYVPDFRTKIALIRDDPDSTLKYVFDRSSGEERLYDLRRDPLEKVDLANSARTRELAEFRDRATAALLGL
jgi:arylsulfatase A-like enzyme